MYRHVCFYVPRHVLDNIAKSRALQGQDVSKIRQSIQTSEAFRQKRLQSAEASLISPQPASPAPKSGGGGGPHVTIPAPETHARLIYDDQNQWNFDVVDVRNEGDPAVAQQNANLAYDALGATLEFYRDVLGRLSDDLWQWRQCDLPGFHRRRRRSWPRTHAWGNAVHRRSPVH